MFLNRIRATLINNYSATKQTTRDKNIKKTKQTVMCVYVNRRVETVKRNGVKNKTSVSQGFRLDKIVVDFTHYLLNSISKDQYYKSSG